MAVSPDECHFTSDATYYLAARERVIDNLLRLGRRSFSVERDLWLGDGFAMTLEALRTLAKRYRDKGWRVQLTGYIFDGFLHFSEPEKTPSPQPLMFGGVDRLI